jgi:hypothetical protein
LRRRTSARLRGSRRICPNSWRGAARKTQKIPAAKSASTAAKASASDRVSEGRTVVSSGLPFFAAGESSPAALGPAASMSRRANGIAAMAAAATRMAWRRGGRRGCCYRGHGACLGRGHMGWRGVDDVSERGSRRCRWCVFRPCRVPVLFVFIFLILFWLPCLIRSGIGGIGRLPERGFTGTYLVQHPDAQMEAYFAKRLLCKTLCCCCFCEPPSPSPSIDSAMKGSECPLHLCLGCALDMFPLLWSVGMF